MSVAHNFRQTGLSLRLSILSIRFSKLVYLTTELAMKQSHISPCVFIVPSFDKSGRTWKLITNLIPLHFFQKQIKLITEQIFRMLPVKWRVRVECSKSDVATDSISSAALELSLDECDADSGANDREDWLWGSLSGFTLCSDSVWPPFCTDGNADLPCAPVNQVSYYLSKLVLVPESVEVKICKLSYFKSLSVFLTSI